MQIVKTERFDEELEYILDFIAKDNINQALIFFDELINKIESIIDFSKKHRQCSKVNDENVRELIFKKYVVVYKIYEDEILILGILNQNLWEM